MSAKHDLLNYLKLQRFANAAFPVMSLLIGVALVGTRDYLAVVFAVVTVFIINGSVTFWNDIDDREVDAHNGRPMLKQIYGSVLYKRYLAVSILQSIICLIAAAWLGVGSLIILLLVVIGGVAYSRKPLRLSHKPALSVVVLSLLGAPLPFLLGTSLGEVGQAGTLVGFFIGLWSLRLSVSILKDYKDAAGDAKHGKKTFLLVYGARKVAIVSVSSLLLGFLIAALTMFKYDLATNVELVGLVLLVVPSVMSQKGLFVKTATYHDYNKIFLNMCGVLLIIDSWILLCLST